MKNKLLRSNNRIKASAPNDGWNKRDKNKVVMVNPYFDRDNGDLICIGNFDSFEVKRITGYSRNFLSKVITYNYRATK